MSLDICRTCRYTGYCTFPRKRAVTECDEFEDMGSAPTYDWNLQELLKLWTAEAQQEPSRAE